MTLGSMKQEAQVLETWVAHDGEQPIQKPFTVAGEALEDSIEGFTASEVSVQAHREMEVNALGEISVIKYHIHSVNI